jgi:hypothetical protein
LASYQLSTNKKSVHIKEPLLITFKAKQKNYNDNMFFSFNIEKSPDFEVKLLHKTIEDNGYHNSIATFEYILFPLQEKTLHVNFNFVIRTASDKAVKQSYVDDHDDSIAISTIDTQVKVEPLTIQVKKLMHHVDLVGDFQLNSHIDTTQIDQFGVVNVHYTLTGKGYKEAQLHLLNKKIENVTVFSKIKDNISKLTEEGYIINTEYIYALTSKEDFKVPALTLEVYSPTKERYYTLHTKAYTIKVKKIDTATLIDKTNAPRTEEFINIETVKKFFIYTLLFLSGFFAAKLSEKSFRKRDKKEKFEDIKNAKSPKELLILLIMHYQNKGVDEDIFKLENALNAKKSLNLNTIKKEILSKLM